MNISDFYLIKKTKNKMNSRYLKIIRNRGKIGCAGCFFEIDSECKKPERCKLELKQIYKTKVLIYLERRRF